jgi:hypothetical protein
MVVGNGDGSGGGGGADSYGDIQFHPVTTKLLDFIHRPDFYKQKTQRFGNWICFRLQARGVDLLLFWHRLWKGKLLVFL